MTIEQASEAAQPQALARGRFALYETPDGGMHISVRLDQEDEDRHVNIPRRMVKLAAALGGRSPASVLQRLVGGNSEA